MFFHRDFYADASYAFQRFAMISDGFAHDDVGNLDDSVLYTLDMPQNNIFANPHGHFYGHDMPYLGNCYVQIYS